jgi:hypothetical protein
MKYLTTLSGKDDFVNAIGCAFAETALAIGQFMYAIEISH